MSFFSDLFEGKFSNLGNDITHAPSSLANHPDELAETLGGAALIAAPFLIPEIGGALGLGAGAEGAAAADVGVGALDAGAFAGDAADAGFALDAGAGLAEGGAAADLGAELGAGAIDSGAFLGDAASGFEASGFGNFGALSDTFAGVGPDVGADVGGAVADATPAEFAQTDAELSGGLTGTAPTSFATPAGATPSGFASTDAELSGGITGAGGGIAPSVGGGGLTQTLGGIISSPWTKLALGAAPLALTLGMGQPGIPAQAQQLQGQALALQQTGLQQLSDANKGILNAGQTAVLNQTRTDLTNQWRQTLFNQGVTDPSKDTRWPQIEGLIDAKVTEQTAQLIQQNITNALAETGQAQQALLAIAQMQMSSDQQFTNNLINATKSLGLVAGLSSGTTIKIGA